MDTKNDLKHNGPLVCQSGEFLENVRRMMEEEKVPLIENSKIDIPEDFENLFRAICDFDYETAQKLHYSVLLKYPKTWQGKFLSLYFKAMFREGLLDDDAKNFYYGINAYDIKRWAKSATDAVQEAEELKLFGLSILKRWVKFATYCYTLNNEILAGLFDDGEFLDYHFSAIKFVRKLPIALASEYVEENLKEEANDLCVTGVTATLKVAKFQHLTSCRSGEELKKDLEEIIKKATGAYADFRCPEELVNEITEFVGQLDENTESHDSPKQKQKKEKRQNESMKPICCALGIFGILCITFGSMLDMLPLVIFGLMVGAMSAVILILER